METQMNLAFVFLIFLTITFSQSEEDYFLKSLKGKWDVEQMMPTGKMVNRINIITDVFEGSGLLCDWYDSYKSYIGSDIRTFNNTSKEWRMQWYNGKKQIWADAHLIKKENNNYVGLSKVDGKRGKFTKRITFFNLKQNSYQWKMEYLPDGQNEWHKIMSYTAKRI